MPKFTANSTYFLGGKLFLATAQGEEREHADGEGVKSLIRDGVLRKVHHQTPAPNGGPPPPQGQGNAKP